MRTYKYFIFVTLLALAGCALTPTYTWVKPQATERQYTIADAACTAEAYKVAPDGQLSDCLMERGRMAQKFCLGTQASKSETLRAKIYDGCMMDKGWEKHPTQ